MKSTNLASNHSGEPSPIIHPRIYDPENTLISIKDVLAITGYTSRSTIYNLIKEGFPKPVDLGGGTVRFVLAEVHAWVQQKINSRVVG